MLLTVIGVTIDLRFDDSVPVAVRADVARAWNRCAAPEDSAARLVVIAALSTSDHDIGLGMGNRRRVVANSAGRLEQQLATYLTLWAIEIQRTSMWLFHAVGLSDNDGRTIALAAPSHMGKTTLASALGKYLGYVTDETLAVLPVSRKVLAYPKPLSVIGRPGEPKVQVAPDELGLKRPVGDLRLVRLGLLSRVPGTREPRVEPLGLREALFELVPQISFLAGRPRALQALCDLISKLGGAVRVVYGEASDVSGLVGSLLNDQSSIHPEWESARVLSDKELPEETVRASGFGVLRRSPGVSDAIWIGDDLVVLSGVRLSCVNGVGVAIWDALERPRSRESLRHSVFARMPPPPSGVDADAAFEAGVEALCRQDIVVADSHWDSSSQS